MFNETILPIWGMKGKVLVTISSPRGRGNFYTKLFSKGLKSINSYEYFGCCDKCKLLKKGHKCQHTPYKYPPWINQDKIGDIQEILQDQQGTFNREMRGLAEDDTSGVYVEQNLIDMLAERRLFSSIGIESPKIVVIAADFNAGGQCDTAFMCLCNSFGSDVVSNIYFYFNFVSVTKPTVIIYSDFNVTTNSSRVTVPLINSEHDLLTIDLQK